jgi:hypothetical protein
MPEGIAPTDDAVSAMICSPPDLNTTFGAEH